MIFVASFSFGSKRLLEVHPSLLALVAEVSASCPQGWPHATVAMRPHPVWLRLALWAEQWDWFLEKLPDVIMCGHRISVFVAAFVESLILADSLFGNRGSVSQLFKVTVDLAVPELPSLPLFPIAFHVQACK